MQTEKYEPADFRGFLQSELVRRTKANPRYSLRAFARLLEVQSGFLSKILLGQRRITPLTVKRFGMKLGLTLAQMEQFQSTCSARSTESVPAPAYRQIAYDHFQVISDWYHFAILELAVIDHFETDPGFIARTLGISRTEAQAAIDRLIRLDYIRLKNDGTWILREGHTTTLGTEETAAALRGMQKQILEKAIEALEMTPIERRDQSAMTMAIDSSKMSEAKKRITKFRRDLCAFLEDGKTKDSVYQLSISLFPLNSDPQETP